MGRAFGFLGLIIVAAAGFYIYSKQITSMSPAGSPAASPRATIDLVGVKNDLLAIAQAERGEFALNGKYVSFEDLRSSGALSMAGDGRGPFKYSVDAGSSSFRAVATYSAGGDPPAGIPHSMSVDDSMQVTQE